jgi:plastocyanin
MSSLRILALFLALGTLAFAACGDSDSETASGGGAEETATVPAGEGGTEAATDQPAPSGDAVRAAKVEIEDFAYEPATVTVEAGGKVTWLNRDSAPHTATLDDGSFSTAELAEGKLGSQSFKEPGTFRYHCEIHPEMTGTVEVVAAGWALSLRPSPAGPRTSARVAPR